MRLFLVFLSFLFLSACAFSEIKEGPSKSEKVEISFRLSSDDKIKPMQLQKGQTLNIDLPLGGNLVSLAVKADGNYKVFQKTETSVTVMNEGPHLDLLDWKHGYSKSVELKKEDGSYQFIKQFTEEIDFSKSSRNDFLKKIEKMGGKQWRDLAEKCKTLKDYPCGVSPSRYFFEIKKEVNGKFEDYGKIVLAPPMGC